jgi:hypothetical protein
MRRSAVVVAAGEADHTHLACGATGASRLVKGSSRQARCLPAPQPGWLCSPLDAVGSVQRRLRWSRRCGMLVIARCPFRVRFGGPFGSPPGFHRRRKLSATFRRKIQFFLRLLSRPSFLRSASLRRLGSCASGASSRFSRGFPLPCCFRRL